MKTEFVWDWPEREPEKAETHEPSFTEQETFNNGMSQFIILAYIVIFLLALLVYANA